MMLEIGNKTEKSSTPSRSQIGGIGQGNKTEECQSTADKVKNMEQGYFVYLHALHFVIYAAQTCLGAHVCSCAAEEFERIMIR